ncbi:MAG: ribosome assembly factor SBDS [archaeon]|nr:ribosome assembly factor SBDS [archaeon]
MGSLDSSVIARLESNGGMFEILLDPSVVDVVGRVEGSDLLSYLVVDTVFKDASKGIRSAEKEMVDAFGTTDITEVVSRIVVSGKIQLTTKQRREMLEAKRRKVVAQVAAIIIDPETRLPHPIKRVELALEESKFHVDLFKPINEHVKDAVRAIECFIPVELKMASDTREDGLSCCRNYLTLKSQEMNRKRR